MVPLINREARLYQLTYTERHQQREDSAGFPIAGDVETHVVKLLPGLNWIPWGQVRHTGFDPRTFRGRIVVQDPLKMEDYAAEELAEATTSGRSLRAWRAREVAADAPRKDVIAAIDRALDRPRNASEASED